MTFGEKVIRYYHKLEFTGNLPDGITMMNPIKDHKEISKICKTFYNKYYDDTQPRKLILGINPGRLGAGATGIPFTDTKRMEEKCGIKVDSVSTHEPSSVFMYDMMEAYGGVEKFYSEFYINSVCPLGFTIKGNAQKEINYNYYDRADLQAAVLDFIEWNIETQIKLGCATAVCYCLGTGKNFKFLHELNNRKAYFGRIEPLEHPRYIMQYKLKLKQQYIESYLEKFSMH